MEHLELHLTQQITSLEEKSDQEDKTEDQSLEDMRANLQHLVTVRLPELRLLPVEANKLVLLLHFNICLLC